MYTIRNPKNLTEADMVWLLEHDDADIGDIERNRANSGDDDQILEQEEIPDMIDLGEN